MTTLIITDPEQLALTPTPTGVRTGPAFDRIRVETTGESLHGTSIWASTTTWRAPYGDLLAVGDWTTDGPEGRATGRRTDFTSGPVRIRVDTRWVHPVDTDVLGDTAGRIASVIRTANEHRDHDVDAPVVSITLSVTDQGAAWTAEFGAPPRRPGLFDRRRIAWSRARSMQVDGPIQPPLPVREIDDVIDMAGTEAIP